MPYMITFDLDTKKLEEVYPGKNYTDAYDDIRDYLTKNGFTHQQGSSYFGEDVNAATCVKIALRLQKKHKWLVPCASDIRMLRIEEDNDLLSVMKELE